MDTSTAGSPDIQAPKSGRRRIQALVALTLLDTLRTQDLPEEILDDENVTLTMPRRLGLSDVIDSQIRRYRTDAGKGRRVPEAEVIGLMRLVVRRPDSEEVFEQVGRSLTPANGAPGWRKVYPKRIAFALARRRVRVRLRELFGSRVVRSAGAPFRLEASGNLLMEGDPGGDACAIVTGLAQSILDAYTPERERVIHSECRGRAGARCIWTVVTAPDAPDAEPAP